MTFLENSLESFQRCATRLSASFAAVTMVFPRRVGRGQGRAMGCTTTDNCVFDEIFGLQIGYKPVETATTWLLSRESGHEEQKR